MNRKGSILTGKNMKLLRKFPDNHFDAVVTDSPYGLGKRPDIAALLRDWLRKGFHTLGGGGGFMNKEWDRFVPQPKFWKEIRRVCKPGAHIMSFFSPRTYHYGVMAMELAGLEIRDQLQWIYGQGFPKSLDLGEALAGTVLEQELQGWGTGLKPAYEPIVLARKPLEGTQRDNALSWKTGGLNVDDSRIPFLSQEDFRAAAFGSRGSHIQGGNLVGGRHNPGKDMEYRIPADQLGRWPANILLDEPAAAQLDQQSGALQSGNPGNKSHPQAPQVFGKESRAAGTPMVGYGDKGGASRFFYVAKASQEERNAGLDEFPDQYAAMGNQARKSLEKGHPAIAPGSLGLNNVYLTKNTNPCVKPIRLMQYLLRLITPPGGLVLDPFAGSGTTGCAAELEDIAYLLMEENPYDCQVAAARCRHWAIVYYERTAQLSLFK